MEYQVILTLYLILQFGVQIYKAPILGNLKGYDQQQLNWLLVWCLVKFVIIVTLLYLGGFYN